MNTTQAQQKALDDALVAPADRMFLLFTCKNFGLQFSFTRHPSDSLLTRGKSLSIDLGHTGDITYLIDVNINYLHQPWRAFATVINKCLSGKEIRMDKIRLFTKIIIDYFMSKDQSFSRRNKMFWHTARDDTMYTSVRCISRHEKTQVYCAILLKELTNQGMLESGAYKIYYAFASGAKTPKLKYVRKKAHSDTSPKQKHVQPNKGTIIKTKAKVTKSDKKKQPVKMIKAKGLVVLSEVALTEAEQLKLATKRSKKDFHISHASGSVDGVETQSKVPDEQQQKISGTDKETDDDENDFDEEANINDDYSDDNDECDDERIKSDSDSRFEQEEEDAHVTLTPVLDVQKTGGPTQSSSISSDFTSKLLNLDNPSPAHNKIASLMDTTAYHATSIPKITSSFATPTPSPPPFFNPLQQEATPTTFEATTSFTSLLDFVSEFKFNERVTNLE
nr:hypothetical protein [Tanacetum cinerariifolium]